MDDDIVYARSNRSLWLQHPTYELVKSFRIRSLWSSVWPLDLSIHDCELKTSTRFSKSILEWRHTVPATKKRPQNKFQVNEIVLSYKETKYYCITLLHIMCSLVTRYLFSRQYQHGLGNPRARELETVLNNAQMSIPIKDMKNLQSQ